MWGARLHVARRSLTGAWIETIAAMALASALEVAPSRGRGLKLLDMILDPSITAVAPSRGRGLKRILVPFACHPDLSLPHGGVD